MIRRIELINFMSHPHTVIEPASGLTVLVGDNNTGKSAVISALQTLCRNISGDFMVRHDERECRVIVETAEGNTLEWKRKSGTVSYTINGREVHRLRGTVPEDLHEFLRLPLVETENDPFDVHFGEQKKPIFLLDESPARRATFFASSSDAIKLIEMQNRHRLKVREAKTEENRLVQEAARLQQRLDALTPVADLEDRLEGVEFLYADIEKTGQDMSRMENHLSRIETMVALSRRHGELVEAGKALTPPPDPAPTEILEAQIRRMTALQSHIHRADDASRALSELLPPPEIADTRHLADLVARIGQTSKTVNRLEDYSRILDACETPPEATDTTAISRGIDAMRKAQITVSHHENELNRIESELSEAAIALRDYIQTNDICPTCGQPIDADQVLHESHRGKT